jgi:hypothetical protein
LTIGTWGLSAWIAATPAELSRQSPRWLIPSAGGLKTLVPLSDRIQQHHGDLALGFFA